MPAKVVSNPQASSYDPDWSSGLMVECRDHDYGNIEWGWGAARETLQGLADAHNTAEHQDAP